MSSIIHPYPAIKVVRKTGDEPFVGSNTPSCLADFWGWAYSNLVSNTERGKLAEFIVSMAMHCVDGVRENWGAFDVHSPEGIKVEVKASAFLQSWSQNRISDVRFGIKESLAWDPARNAYAESAKRQADVYVFCVENCKKQDILNPLDLRQWDFYPIATDILNKAVGKQKSVGLNTLVNLGAKKCGFLELRKAILIQAKGEADWLFIEDLIKRSRWIFAKTMPENPHYYMLRKETDDAEFVRFVEIIRKLGYKQDYEGYSYIVLDDDGWRYWTMGAPIEETILINRKNIGIQP